MKKISTKIFGLKYELENEPHFQLENLYGTRAAPEEFSSDNRGMLLLYFNKIANNCVAILEIGVQRNELIKSSTGVFLSNKNKNTIYLGIDINDRSHLNDVNNNIHILNMDSKNIELVELKMKELNINGFDFIFIDGNHSINMAFNDWKYVKYLNSRGIIGYHDTSVHDGPVELFNAVDENFFVKEKYLESNNNDWGISFFTKKI